MSYKETGPVVGVLTLAQQKDKWRALDKMVMYLGVS